MAFDYARSTATADRLLAKFGQTGTLKRPTSTGPAHNPTEGEPDEHACTFVVEEFKAFEIDGSRVLATDKKVLLAKGSLTIEPTTTDKLMIGGIPHSIVRIEPVAPGGVTVMYMAQCRR